MTDFRHPGNGAVITGGASGIGLAAAHQMVNDGMNVLIADRNEEALTAAVENLNALGRGKAFGQPCDVAEMANLETLRTVAADTIGKVHCLMNNAGGGFPTSAPWEDLDALKTTLAVNLMGVVHGCHAFIPDMLAHGEAGVIINTGSKQGITRPPGNYAYNLSKAGVLAYTESVAYGLRQIEDCKLSAHLLVPGFVYTGLVARFIPEKPPSAWTAEQTVEFALPCIERGDFYIICPDNDVTRDMDEKRMQWTADDLIKNRPALSRWHDDYKDAFDEYMKG